MERAKPHSSLSKEIFSGVSFEHITDQSHGESDFVDSNGQSYDVKLLFDKKQGELIWSEKNDIKEWLKIMHPRCDTHWFTGGRKVDEWKKDMKAIVAKL